jgi:uncharacterized protein YjbJ (UPF0337 family)/ferredoxin-like protein FixX
LQFLTGGYSWGFMPMEHHVAGHERMEFLEEYDYKGDSIKQRYPDLKFDNKLTFDKVTDVYHGAVSHDEDQPFALHILDTEICAVRCAEEYGNPCQRFCPAAVYEMEDNPKTGRREIKVNFSNCVHCKTCDIMDPYQIINWVTPEAAAVRTTRECNGFWISDSDLGLVWNMNCSLRIKCRICFRNDTRNFIKGDKSMSIPNNDEVEGKAENIGGKIKEGIGNLTGDRSLEAEGEADQAEGQTQETWGKFKRGVVIRLMLSAMRSVIPAKMSAGRDLKAGK